MNASALQILAAPLGVGEKRIAAVDDNIPLFHERNDFADETAAVAKSWKR